MGTEHLPLAAVPRGGRPADEGEEIEMDDVNRRFVLGAVARHELFRDLAGTTRRWVAGSAQPVDSVVIGGLHELEADGLIVLPELPDARRGERYWELTDKALES